MARRPKHDASRKHAGQRAAGAMLLVFAGVLCGGLLGHMAVGKGLRGGGIPAAPSFASLSANPDARIDHAEPLLPCPDCADGYGAAARLRAARYERMEAPFRKLGEVDSDRAPSRARDDDYVSGGRFPDPPARANNSADNAPEPVPEPPMARPVIDDAAAPTPSPSPD